MISIFYYKTSFCIFFWNIEFLLLKFINNLRVHLIFTSISIEISLFPHIKYCNGNFLIFKMKHKWKRVLGYAITFDFIILNSVCIKHKAQVFL